MIDRLHYRQNWPYPLGETVRFVISQGSPTMAAMKLAPPTRMTYEEFLTADFGDQTVDWVDGRVIEIGTVSDSRDKILCFLKAVLSRFLDYRGLTAEVADGHFVYPPNLEADSRSDLLVVQKARDHDGVKAAMASVPLLVVDIADPADRIRDTVLKVLRYIRDGVDEYWLEDPKHRNVAFFQRSDDGRFCEATPDEHGVYQSSAIDGLWISTDWLFSDPMPPAEYIFRKWNLQP